jgi:hypothetical protein
VERVIICILLFLLLAGFMAFRGCDQLWLIAAMHYQPPANNVVYDDDPQQSPLLVGTGKYQYLCGGFVRTGPHPRPAGWIARPLGSLGNDAIGSCFLHSRRTPAGAGRLVWLSFTLYRETAAGYQLDLSYASSRPPSLLGSLDDDDLARGQLSILVPDGERLRIFTGIPDDADESHFTVRYELAGETGMIDGWLRSDDADGIVLKVRNGPLKLEKWVPPPEVLDPRHRTTTSPQTPTAATSPSAVQSR